MQPHAPDSRPPVRWLEPFVEEHQGTADRNFFVPDWTGKSPFAAGAKFRPSNKSPGQIYSFAPEKSVLKLVELTILEAASRMGKDRAWLKEQRLTGTHAGRHWPAVWSSLLKWPERDRHVSGDWVPPAADGEGAAKVKPGSKKKSMPDTYAPNFPKAEQLAVRGRLFAATRVGLAAFHLFNELSAETSWEEVRGVVPTAEVSFFMGPRPLPNPADRKRERPPPAVSPPSLDSILDSVAKLPDRPSRIRRQAQR